MSWAVKIHSYLTVANVNAWVWWFLTDMPRQGEGTDNAALTDINGNIPKRAYVSGQWSKFVRPGWSRIGVTYFGPLLITGFKDPESHSFAIVAVNPSARAVHQTFSLNGFSANSVTPWITSTGLSLAAQTPVSVSGTKFTYTLQPASVTTFSGAVLEVR
jgi:glucuronoarabinoxylan endo-1,4-beta-xylanase